MSKFIFENGSGLRPKLASHIAAPNAAASQINATPPANSQQSSTTQTSASDEVRESLALCDDERWYLVHTLPKKDTQARMHLRVQGFRTFLPQYLRTVRHARQLRTVRAPLFPSYLFVILNLKRDRWLSVRSTIGVSHLVGHEHRPIPVPHGIVEALIVQTDASNLTIFADKLEKGQKVRITTGPFTDFIGTLDRLDEAGRVRLLLDMMGSEIAITLPRAGILPAA